ncbi:MAG: hypothetical protein A2X36_12620 [Elusimicrobia bacterium GWA2_69_24]|nr:MAG: hypothetical protein A2X36_12620 [Elusimicrobia bacterium GWA2_69_24]HBL17435.1 hypothetical protein [Elusimicrobiota bacterium]
MPRILIVDDDPSLVQLLTMALKTPETEIASAGDPAEGLAVCRKFHPDIILLDYHLPGDTGAHLFETLRRNTATAKTPILFMSAVATADHMLREVADPKFSRFMPKPVHIADLQRNIQEMLAGAES